MLLAQLIPLAYVATGVLIPPSAYLDCSGTELALTTMTLVVLLVSMLTLLVVLVLDPCRSHTHAAPWYLVIGYGVLYPEVILSS